MADTPSLPTAGTVTVEVDRLRAFSEAMRAEVEDLSASMNEIITGSLASVMVNFGGGGLVEGQAFQDPHAACQNALAQFARDAAMGLACLGAGAGVAALEYVDGDASSAEVIAAINNLYAPRPIDPVAVGRLADELERQERQDQQAYAEEFEDRVDAARDDPATSEGSGTPEIPGSDYYETDGAEHRGTVNDGTPYEVRIGNDNEDVSEVRLPGQGETFGENAMSDREFQEDISEFPDRVQDLADERLAEANTP